MDGGLAGSAADGWGWEYKPGQDRLLETLGSSGSRPFGAAKCKREFWSFLLSGNKNTGQQAAKFGLSWSQTWVCVGVWRDQWKNRWEPQVLESEALGVVYSIPFSFVNLIF